MPTLKTLSQLMGAAYVTAWSVSFYPPLILNYQLKSSEGISTDFIFMNIVGYIALVASMCLMLYNTDVRTRYHERHGYYPLLTKIDLVYSVHGLILTLVMISQLFFWGFKKRSMTLKRITKIIVAAVFVMFAGAYSSVAKSGTDDVGRLTLLDIAVLLSYIKIFMSLIKYIPQVSHNRKRRSVQGFSMTTILLDTTGGVLSTVQLFIDSYIATGELSLDILMNNSGKLGLSAVTLFFDACFVYQWYVYERLPKLEAQKLDEKLLQANATV